MNKTNEQTAPESLVTVTIFRDGKELKKFEHEKNDFCAFRWLLNYQSNSTDWALKYEGYKVELKDETSGETSYWKHSGQK